MTETGGPGPVGRVARVGLAVLAVAAGGALSTASGSVFGWALVPVAALSLVRRIGDAPDTAVKVASVLARALVVAVVLVAVFQSFYPALGRERIAQIQSWTGLVVVPAAGLALLATPVLAPARGFAPLALALLVVSGLDRGAPLVPWYALAAAGGVAYLAGSVRRVGPPAPLTPRRLARTGGLVALGAATAVGIALFLPWAQPKVEEVVRGSPPRTGADFSVTSRIGDVESIALSRTVALRVWSDRPRKLRARVLTRFDGQAWHVGAGEAEEMRRIAPDALPADLAGWLARAPGSTFGEADAVAAGGAGRMIVAPAATTSAALFTPGPALAVRVAAEGVLRHRAGTLEVPGTLPAVYAVVHGAAGEPVSVAYDPVRDSAALSVPEGIDPRVRALAARLAEGTTSAEERLARTLDHLHRGYRYSLSTGAPAPGARTAGPVAEFLFETRQGWCEYFATSATILLRLQGVPARYVTGFSMDGATRSAGHWVVRESDAHAWVEAYLPGRGWVEADPTPASDYAAFHQGLRDGLPGRLLEAVRAAFAELALAVRMGDWRSLARRVLGVLGHPVTLVVVVLGMLIVVARRRGIRRSPGDAAPGAGPVDPELARLAVRVESLWASCGRPRPAHRAPLEHLVAAEARLPAGLRDPSRAVVECLYRARYAGVPPAPGEVGRLRSALDAAEV